ncbi:MAG TPA: hypothetical protein VFV99_15220 [Kofleriaceae bacterium]|nr:hypothetical protein [Kofleriaceae bacterium]
MKTCYSAFVFVFAGCVVNGKAYGPGSSTTNSSTTSGATTAEPSGSTSTSEAAATNGAPPQAGSPVNDQVSSNENAPYPDAPADPWAGVAGDQPKRRSDDRWTVRTRDFACTAAHDHCLDTDAWFIVDMQPRPLSYQRNGEVYVFGKDEPFGAWNAVMKNHGPDHYVAYRTVPATKQNLAPGVLVFGYKSDYPANGRKAVEDSWAHGKVASIDLELGYYTLEGREQQLRLSGARVAVLRWEPGGKVEIIGGKRRDELAVRAADVFLPAPERD